MDFNSEAKSSAASNYQEKSKRFLESDYSLITSSDLNKYSFFLEKPHKNLYCPICFDLFKSPVLIDCSHTVCDGCLNQNNPMCPLCNKACKVKLSNRNIEEQIGDLLIRFCCLKKLILEIIN